MNDNDAEIQRDKGEVGEIQDEGSANMAGSYEADGLNWGFENSIGLRQVGNEI